MFANPFVYILTCTSVCCRAYNDQLIACVLQVLIYNSPITALLINDTCTCINCLLDSLTYTVCFFKFTLQSQSLFDILLNDVAISIAQMCL